MLDEDRSPKPGWTEVTILDGFIHKTTIHEVLAEIDRFNQKRLIDVNTGPLIAAKAIRDEGSGNPCRYAVVGNIREVGQRKTDRNREFGFIEFRDSPGREKLGVWIVRRFANCQWATTYFEALGEYLRMVYPELGAGAATESDHPAKKAGAASGQAAREFRLKVSTEVAAAELEAHYNRSGGWRLLPRLKREETQSALIRFILTEDGDESGDALFEFRPAYLQN